jgi:acetyl esterase/lipase
MKTFLALRSLLFLLLIPGTVAGYIPLRILRASRQPFVPDRSAASLLAGCLILFGAFVLLRCVWDFLSAGRGTLAPFDPPKVLVVRGLYRFTRNPMYNGVLAVLAGEAWLFRSTALLQYAVFMFLLFHLVVVVYEEPVLDSRFGESYRAYRRAVPRWGFTVHPFTRSSGAAAIAILGATLSCAPDPLETAAFEYRVFPNLTYRTVEEWTGRLDLYVHREGRSKPALLWIHGGGWTEGSKEEDALFFLPYLADGWTIVSVEYRLAPVAVAPAAVEDCRCALAWLLRNAASYGVSTERVVVSGISAGGHLALTTAGLYEAGESECRLPPGFKPAAVVNWYGPSDLSELAFGENAFAQAVEWIGGRRDVAQRVSPLRHVSASAPPVLTIHGTADDVIPSSQSVRLHQALSNAGVANRLVTLEGAHHGDFTAGQIAHAYEAVRSFLRDHVTER